MDCAYAYVNAHKRMEKVGMVPAFKLDVRGAWEELACVTCYSIRA